MRRHPRSVHPMVSYHHCHNTVGFIPVHPMVSYHRYTTGVSYQCTPGFIPPLTQYSGFHTSAPTVSYHHHTTVGFIPLCHTTVGFIPGHPMVSYQCHAIGGFTGHSWFQTTATIQWVSYHYCAMGSYDLDRLDCQAGQKTTGQCPPNGTILCQASAKCHVQCAKCHLPAFGYCDVGAGASSSFLCFSIVPPFSSFLMLHNNWRCLRASLMLRQLLLPFAPPILNHYMCTYITPPP